MVEVQGMVEQRRYVLHRTILMILLTSSTAGWALTDGILSVLPPPPLGDGDALDPFVVLDGGLRIHPLSESASWSGVIHPCRGDGIDQGLRITWHGSSGDQGALGFGWALSTEERIVAGIEGTLHHVEPDGYRVLAVVDDFDERKTRTQAIDALVDELKNRGIRVTASMRRKLGSSQNLLLTQATWIEADSNRPQQGTYLARARGARTYLVTEKGTEVTYADGRKTFFDDHGRLVRRQGSLGGNLVIERDGENGRPLQQRVSGCPNINFSYDDDGRLEAIVGSDGDADLSWDDDQRLDSVLVAGSYISFDWDRSGYLSKLLGDDFEYQLKWQMGGLSEVEDKHQDTRLSVRVTAPSINQIGAQLSGHEMNLSWAFDVMSRQMTIHRDGLLLERITYDDVNQPTEYRNGSGRVVTIEWDATGFPKEVSDGSVTLRVDEGATPATIGNGVTQARLQWRDPRQLVQVIGDGRFVEIERDMGGRWIRMNADGVERRVQRGIDGLIGRYSSLGEDYRFDWDSERRWKSAHRGDFSVEIFRDRQDRFKALLVGEEKFSVGMDPHGRVETLRWGYGPKIDFRNWDTNTLSIRHEWYGDQTIAFHDGEVRAIETPWESLQIYRNARGYVTSLRGTRGVTEILREDYGTLTGWVRGDMRASVEWRTGRPARLEDPLVGIHIFGFSRGHLSSWSGPTSGRTTFEWGSWGGVRRITDAWGGDTIFERGTDGNVVEMRMPIHQWRRTIDSQGDTVEDDTGWLVHARVDPFGEIIALERQDEHGLLVPMSSLELDADGVAISGTDQIGRRTTIPEPIVASPHHDQAGRPLVVHRGDETLDFHRDKGGAVTALRDAEGNALWKIESNEEGITSWTGSPLGTLVLSRDPWARLEAVQAVERAEVGWDSGGRVGRLSVSPSDVSWTIFRDIGGDLSAVSMLDRRLSVTWTKDRELQFVELPGGRRVQAQDLPVGRGFEHIARETRILQEGMTVDDLPLEWPEEPDEAWTRPTSDGTVMIGGLEVAWRNGERAVPDPRGTGTIGRMNQEGHFYLDPVRGPRDHQDRPLAVFGAAYQPTLGIPLGLGMAAPLWAGDPEPRLSLDAIGPSFDRRGMAVPWAKGVERLDTMGTLVLLGRLSEGELREMQMTGEVVPGPRFEVPGVDILRGIAIMRRAGSVRPDRALGIVGAVDELFVLEPHLRGVVFPRDVETLGALQPWSAPSGVVEMRRLFRSWDDSDQACAMRSPDRNTGTIGIDGERGLRYLEGMLCLALGLDRSTVPLIPVRYQAESGRAAIVQRLGTVSEARIGFDGYLLGVDLGAAAKQRRNRELLLKLGGRWPSGSPIRLDDFATPEFLPSRAGSALAGWGYASDDQFIPLTPDGTPHVDGLR